MDEATVSDGAGAILLALGALGVHGAEARAILAELLLIDGRIFQHEYEARSHRFLFDAYRVIASKVVSATSSDEVIEEAIPRMIHAFAFAEDWPYSNCSIETFKMFLQGSISEWKGRRLLDGHTSAKETDQQLAVGSFTEGIEPTTESGDSERQVNIRRLETYYRTDGKHETEFYRHLRTKNDSAITPQEFSAWKGGRSRKIGHEKSVLLDKALRAWLSER